ncbi:hypothetical protein PT141_04560, partial (plasmid) [Borreliella garinii]
CVVMTKDGEFALTNAVNVNAKGTVKNVVGCSVMKQRPPRSRRSRSSAASDVYKDQNLDCKYLSVSEKSIFNRDPKSKKSQVLDSILKEKNG